MKDLALTTIRGRKGDAIGPSKVAEHGRFKVLIEFMHVVRDIEFE
jgi:hypothetical protein